MNHLWTDYLEYLAGHSNRGSLRSPTGLRAAWVNSALIIGNATFLAAAPRDEASLAACFRTALDDAAAQPWPMAFFLYDPWVANFPAGRVDEIAATVGLARMMGVDVMTGDVTALAAPARPQPGLTYRRIDDPASALLCLDLNIGAYGMPAEISASVHETGAYFKDLSREFGYIAYDGDTPVSTATAVALNGWLYVALVATSPDHRQKGYAEAVMRYALREASRATGLTRTSLDATEMGAPVYRRMGYTSTGETWGMYAAAH